MRNVLIASALAAIFVAGCGVSGEETIVQGNTTDDKPTTETMASAKPEVKGWITSFDEAKKLSKETGKPILADFTGSDWCGWCIQLKDEVFEKEEFKKWAAENVILLEVDFPTPDGDVDKAMSAELKKQNADLADKYKIEGYPTILFIDAEGNKIGEYGYDQGGPAKWTAEAEKRMGAKS
ncbi:MAG: thioredoxin family protein [Fimbriimonadaceae bacterium]|nr:thioredoxin family protein [Fimbriimonadaceae bacterium]